MGAKHTPGPWSVATDGQYKVASVSSKTGIYADQMPHESSITADARLIASAPELLEALRAMEDATHTTDPHVQAAASQACRAAIAKAEGA